MLITQSIQIRGLATEHYQISGKRIKRGLYKTKSGKIVNSLKKILIPLRWGGSMAL